MKITNTPHSDLKINDLVRIWVTGEIKGYEAQVVEIDPIQLQITGWPMRLKEGDFIILGRIDKE